MKVEVKACYLDALYTGTLEELKKKSKLLYVSKTYTEDFIPYRVSLTLIIKLQNAEHSGCPSETGNKCVP